MIQLKTWYIVLYFKKKKKKKKKKKRVHTAWWIDAPSFIYKIVYTATKIVLSRIRIALHCILSEEFCLHARIYLLQNRMKFSSKHIKSEHESIFTEHSAVKKDISRNQLEFISRNFCVIPFCTYVLSACHTVEKWKIYSHRSHQNFFRQITSLVIYLVNPLVSRNFCQKSVRVNSRNFHSVHAIPAIPQKEIMTDTYVYTFTQSFYTSF